MLGVLAAARTKRLRIGTAVSLAALYHPLRLAEEVALLDVLSGGRVNWGAGRGFAHSEFNAFGVPVEESADRFREAVEIVLKALGEGRFTYHGKHFTFDDIELLPKPMSLGPLGNTIAGAIGGLGGGQLLSALIPALAGATGGADLGALVGHAVGGGIGGAILTVIAGFIKNKMMGGHPGGA